MRGEISSGRFDKRHPYDWYVEEQWVTDQLVRALGGLKAEREADLAIWDPCAGYGHVGSAIEGWGFRNRIYLSDIVENVAYDDFAARPTFFSADFLELREAPAPCSISMNQPYSYKKGIAEAFVRHALALTTKRVCCLVPTKWQASQKRYQLFAVDHPPQAVLQLTQRPSMPPGDRIQAMGSRAYRGGMIDYCWIVWDVTRPTKPGDTRTIWLPPLAGDAILTVEGLA